MGLQVLAAINRILDESGDESRSQRRRLAVGILSDRYRGKHFFVTREQAVRFQALFADTNERLRQAAFPNCDAPLFDDDFTEYPETDSNLEIDKEKILRLAHQTLDEVEQLARPTRHKHVWRRLIGKLLP